jgi:hypothetical protein
LGVTRSAIIALLFGLAATHAFAQADLDPEDTQPQTPGPAAEPAPAGEPFFSFLDTPHSAISNSLKYMASAMDEFFADERVFYEKSGSYIRLTVDTVQEEGGETSYKGDVKLKLRLPRTQKKLKFILESNPETQRDTIDRTLEESPAQAAEENDYYAGIQATLGNERKWQFHPGIGVKFGRPFDVFARIRADRSYRTGDWLFRPSQTFYAFKEKGFRSDTAFDLDYKVSDRLLFRSSSFIRYTDENDYFEPSQVFSLLQGISKRRGIAYQVGVYGITDPTWHATDYLLQVRYRQNIHSDYLFLELIPKILYQRENEFEAEHSLTMRLEMIFDG